MQGPRFLDEPPPPRPPTSVKDDQKLSPEELPAGASRGWVEGVAGPEGALRNAEVATLSVSPSNRPALVIGALALVWLLVGIAVLELANFVADQFARAMWLGIASLAALAPAALVIIWSILREWNGYAALSQIETLRHGLAGQDVTVVRRHAEIWMRAVGVSPEAQKVVCNAPDAATLRDLLRAGPLAQAQARTEAAGRAAAIEILAVTVVSPWPGLDGVLVIWRSFRLVRQIAQIHGHRPGLVGTLALFRRVALDAGAVAAVDVAVSTGTEALFNSPMVGGLAGQAAGSAVAARRMLRLTFAAAESCRPV